MNSKKIVCGWKKCQTNLKICIDRILIGFPFPLENLENERSFFPVRNSKTLAENRGILKESGNGQGKLDQKKIYYFTK